MALKRLADATVEPLTLAEAKAHMRIVSNADDALITALLTVARTMCEERLHRTLVETTWELSLDYFPDAIPLRMARVMSVTSVKYIDTDGVLITLDPASYSVDDKSEPGWITPAFGYTWPSTRCQPNAVTVVYKCGYGSDASTVPTPIKQWLKIYVAEMYEQREATVIGPGLGILRIPYVDRLLDTYVIYG